MKSSFFRFVASISWGLAASDRSSSDPSTALAVFSAVDVLPSRVTEGSPIAAPEQRFHFAHAGAVTVAQDWSSHSLGASVWSAGVMLAHYLDEEAPLLLPCAQRSEDELNGLHNLTGCTAIEVGSGASGLGSLVLERLGATVVATDGDDAILPLLKDNLAAASAHDRVLPLVLPWGNVTAAHVARRAVAALHNERARVERGGRRRGGEYEGNGHTEEFIQQEASFDGHTNELDDIAAHLEGHSSPPLPSSAPDLVLAADVVYPGNAEHWPKLLQTLAQLAAPGADKATIEGDAEATNRGAPDSGASATLEHWSASAVAAKVKPAIVLVALTRRGGGSAMVEAFLEVARGNYGFIVDVIPAIEAFTGAVQLGDGNELYRFSL